jgi:hypothetical protein
MQTDLRDLQITETDLELITGLDVSNLFVGGAYRASIFKNFKTDPKLFAAFCFSEIVTLLLILIFVLPLTIFGFQNFNQLVSDRQSSWLFFSTVLAIALILFSGWNLYMWSRSKNLVLLSHLLDEVDKYNQVVIAVNICDRLKEAGNKTANFMNRADVITALDVTKDSLICGLNTEKILREHRNFLINYRELFANIEQNLITLKTLEVKNQAHEYGKLLSEALEIGISIQTAMAELET